jgi:hypothetical protein
MMLSLEEAIRVGVLMLSNYDAPARWVGKALAQAKKLEREGLLERDPTTSNVFRRTEAGARAVSAMAKAMVHEIGVSQKPKRKAKSKKATVKKTAPKKKVAKRGTHKPTRAK